MIAIEAKFLPHSDSLSLIEMRCWVDIGSILGLRAYFECDCVEIYS